MNLLQALNSLSPSLKGGNEPSAEETARPAPPPPAPKAEEFNAMASVLERHERIANRVRARN